MREIQKHQINKRILRKNKIKCTWEKTIKFHEIGVRSLSPGISKQLCNHGEVA